MNNLLQLEPRDIVAILVLVCFVYLKVLGINSEIDPIIMIVIGYYFVKKAEGRPPKTGGTTV